MHKFPVAIAAESHPFPSRTRKLSLPAPMVLGGRPPGRVGRRRISLGEPPAHAQGALFVFTSPLWPPRASLPAFARKVHLVAEEEDRPAPRPRRSAPPSGSSRSSSAPRRPSSGGAGRSSGAPRGGGAGRTSSGGSGGSGGYQGRSSGGSASPGG